MDLPLDRRAVFIGCARNCSATIERVLHNISRMSGLFRESAFLFLENDSTDSTKAQLQSWCDRRPNARVVSLDGLRSEMPLRPVRLALVRNKYLAMLKSEFNDFDYVFILDCDEVNTRELSTDAVRRAIGCLEQDAACAGVLANMEGAYYDLWALRHPVLCPGDVWEEVCDYAMSRGVGDERAFEETFKKRIFTLGCDAPPLAVDSAFGGLGIYRIASILKNPWAYSGWKFKDVSSGPDGQAKRMGWLCCEHVSFHRGFRELGERLFILPYLINCNTSRYTIPSNAWRDLLFDIRRNQMCPCGSQLRYKHCHGKHS